MFDTKVEVTVHLLRLAFVKYYYIWNWHGEEEPIYGLADSNQYFDGECFGSFSALRIVYQTMVFDAVSPDTNPDPNLEETLTPQAQGFFFYDKDMEKVKPH